MNEWFTGVVEDIFDPLEMNRVRVRCFGYHTHDKALIRTEDLPWATVMMPTTSASTSGIGNLPHGLLQGSWVVGFFRDGDSAQDPLILGSIASMSETGADASKGFNDPDGAYPELAGESDVSRMSRSFEYTDHEVYQNKEKGMTLGTQKAIPPNISWIERPDADYDRDPWDELYPLNGQMPEYPHNRIYHSESGHVQEFDDTPNSPRYHRYHPAGTYEEIYAKGQRMFKVVGEDYEIYLKGKNVSIIGNVNITVDGNVKQRITGNYDLEVEKDFNMNVKGNIRTKVGINADTEILGHRTTHISKNDNLTVVQDQFLNITKGSKTDTIKTNYSITTSGNFSSSTWGTFDNFSLGDMKVTVGAGNLITTVSDTYKLDVAADIDVDAADLIKIDSSGSDVDIDANNIWLN